jgi:hypothetical protein
VHQLTVKKWRNGSLSTESGSSDHVGSNPNNDKIGDPPPKERGEIEPLIGKSSFRPYSLT